MKIKSRIIGLHFISSWPHDPKKVFAIDLSSMNWMIAVMMFKATNAFFANAENAMWESSSQLNIVFGNEALYSL